MRALTKSVPEREGSEAKEVFAFFGLAMYHGQVFEQELIIFAVMLHLSSRTQITRADVDKLFETFEARTVGQLLREARSLTVIPSDLEPRLAQALRVRNDLAYSFFARHSEDFMSDTGRVEMIDELRAATALFEEVDAAVTAIREPLSQKLGISAELAQRELEKMLARARARDGEVSLPDELDADFAALICCRLSGALASCSTTSCWLSCPGNVTLRQNGF